VRDNDFRRRSSSSRNISLLIFLIVAIIGGAIGSLTGGEAGSRIGFVVMGVSALILPYRRWLTQLFSAHRN